MIVPAGTAVEFVGAVFEDGRLHAKTTVSASPSPVQESGTTGLRQGKLPHGLFDLDYYAHP